MRNALYCAGVLAIACTAAVGPSPALGQSPSAGQTPGVTEDRLNQLEQRLNARDKEVADLKAEVERLRQARAATPSAAPANGDDIARAQQDALRQIDAKDRSTLSLKPPVSFNPDLAVIVDFTGTLSNRGDNPARNRFDIASVELDLRAAVAPIADAVAVLPLEREVESELFFDPTDAGGEVESGIDIEEAYLFLHDFGVPNLTAKLGRYHLRFGRQNQLHRHNWATSDNTFVNQSFLGEEALTDAGLSLSYVLPPEWVGGQYIEVIGEIITGEGNDGPVVNNTALIDSPALNLHALWNRDLADNWNLEAGTSFLATKRNDDNSQHAQLYGLDFTLIHTDPTGGFNNQLFQVEAIYGDVDTSRDDTQHAFGAYVLAQQQINRNWYIGARLDWTENANDDTQEVWGISPYVTWYYFEFLRFRLEYQHKGGDVPTEDVLFFQATWTFGAHPPHPYWAMK